MIFGKYAAIGGVLAISALWPFATGQLAHIHYEKEIAKFESDYIEFTQVDYDRGYLSSNIITEVAFKGPLLQARINSAEPISFQIMTKLKHGFLGVEGESIIGNRNQANFSDVVPFTDATFFVNLLGNANIEAHFNALQSYTSSSQITTSSAILEASMRRDGHVSFQLTLPELAISREGEQLTLNQFDLSGQGKMQNKVWIGDQHFSAGSIDYRSVINGNWQVQKSKIHFQNELYKSLEKNNDQDAWRINTLAFVSAEEIKGGRGTFDAKNLQFGIKMEGLDYSSLLAMMNAKNEFSEKALELASSTLDNLVAKGLKFSLPVDFEVQQGSINGLFNLDIAKISQQTADDPSQLFERIRGDMTLTLPKALVDENSLAFGILAQQGFLSDIQDKKQISVSIVGDELVSPSGTRIPYDAFLPFFM